MEIKSKKGQLFTIISVLVLTLMFLSFELYSYIQQGHLIKTRVKTMDSFLYSIESNLQRRMYIIGFRMIFLAENKITSSGNYINPDSFFNEAFFNGTVDGEPDDFLVGATYQDLIDSVNEKANKINVNITLSNTTINFSQDDPWHVKFSMTSDLVMKDLGGLAKWSRKQKLVSYIPITSFEDPLFTVNSLAKISRKINRTIYEGNYRNGGDSTNLSIHVNNGNYAENIYAPNFLMRLAGNLSSDINGIESFVNLPEFSQQGLPVKDKSCIDYIYFSSRNPPSQTVEGMPSWFKIDSEDNHTIKYQIS